MFKIPENSWNTILNKLLKKYDIENKLIEEKEKFNSELEIYPKKELIFNAFSFFEITNLKVVIIGQDPYINENQAMGLCFSVPEGTKLPLLLNKTLTVFEKVSNSHKKIWKGFAEDLIQHISNNSEGIIFVLWGNDAKKLKKYINDTHYILENTHPSPLARKSFIDCDHFTEVNNILKKMNKNEINWKI